MADIDGIEALVREVRELRRRVTILESGAGRSISLGTSYRIQVINTGAAAILQAVRTADNNTVQLAP